METVTKTVITVEATINAPLEKVWQYWTAPEHITQWNNASDDWHTPYAENDLKDGGKFKSTMAARDGSMSFDFEGVYDKVDQFKSITYTIADGRKVQIAFIKEGDKTRVVETFEAEGTHPVEMQKAGWQAIMDNFKKHAEASKEKASTNQNIQQKITPFLWFDNNAEEAVNFYVSVFKDAKIKSKTYYTEGSMMPKGTVMTINFQVEKQDFVALNGGKHYQITPAVSFVVNCNNQEEIDYYWNKLSADPKDEQCGWLKDKFGVSWQIVPAMLNELLSKPDSESAARAVQALMKMKKIVIADLLNA